MRIIILSFDKTAHWYILYATQSKPLNFTSSDLWPQEPRYDWWTPLIIRFRESYNSMNMSPDSTSLKKSSSDCLKLAKQRYSILSEMMLFLTTAFSQVVQKHWIGVVGNYSSCWLLIFSVTCVPNIMKIQQCFLKLQQKMSGMFLWDTLLSHCDTVRADCSWQSDLQSKQMSIYRAQLSKHL